MKRIRASLGVLIPLLVQGVIELSRIIIAIIQTPDKKEDANDDHTRKP